MIINHYIGLGVHYFQTHRKMGTIDAIEHDPAGLKCKNKPNQWTKNNQLFVREPLFILLCHQTWDGENPLYMEFFFLAGKIIL